MRRSNLKPLSAARPIVPPGTPFPPGVTDLQSWIRNSDLDPDWLRIGTDIVGGTTFNAAFWELYVFACLKEMGFTVDFSYPAPDFVVLRDGQPAFCIEAVVASNANDGTPEWQRHWNKGKEADLAKVIDDADELLAFFDFPAEHWIHLKTSNPIESR